MTLVFAYTLVDNCVERPDGVIIGSAFILLVLEVSAVSRSVRATEIRVSEAHFVDETSAVLGPSLVGKKVHLVPMKARSPEARARKGAEIRRYYRIDEPLAFMHVNLLDNRSDFLAPLRVEVRREGPDYVIDVHGAIAIANTIAYLSETVDPISIFLSLTRQDLTRQALRFLFLGEGETGLLVYAILLRYWEWTAEHDVDAHVLAEAPVPSIVASNCVYHHLAQEFREVCEFDLGLLEILTGQRADHTECMVRGGKVCRFPLHPLKDEK